MHEAQKNEKAFGFEIAAADAVTAIIAVSATNGMTPARLPIKVAMENDWATLSLTREGSQLKRADQWAVLLGNRLIRHSLRICDKALVSTPNKDIVDLRFGVPAIKRDEVGVTLFKFGVHDAVMVGATKDGYSCHGGFGYAKTTMTAVAVFRCSDVTIKVTCHNSYIF
ncbi:unnamed protein product [Heligmosomoides polygyrus]|uniref:Ald_Xan_dh_C2 domain-containing protein n=1 Tax=Heligmosomoides polygyrus TaxID=6339 RepID=A0A3P8BIJ7_HELPZ|nr:unnamed protein product [Heligmosomoides polygyrus]